MIEHNFFGKERGQVGDGFQAFLTQVHGNECLVVDGSHQGKPEADAFVTNQKNVTLNIVTADCGPVLFQGASGEGHEVIAAVHAGWRGALSGVCENTIDQMVALGVECKSIKAMIGPCIQQQSYEVDEKFKQSFLTEDKQSEGAFIDHGEKYLFDLSGYIEQRLRQHGVRDISVDQRDTYTNESFYSYRRMTHENKITKDRQVSSIVILDDL